MPSTSMTLHNNNTLTMPIEASPPPASTASASRPLVLLSRKPSFVQQASRTTTTPALKSHRLQPKTLAPLRCSTARAPLAFLANVERVAISGTRKRNGVTYYVLDVFCFHSDSRLPTMRSHPQQQRRSTASAPSPTSSTSSTASTDSPRAAVQHQSAAPRAPDFQLERRYSDFTWLREQAYLWSCVNPQFICDYCNELVSYVRFKLYQPRFITRFTTTTKQRQALLQSFLTDFIALAQFRGHHCGNCEAHEHFPHLVETFVRDTSGVDIATAAAEHVHMPSWQ